MAYLHCQLLTYSEYQPIRIIHILEANEYIMEIEGRADDRLDYATMGTFMSVSASASVKQKTWQRLFYQFTGNVSFDFILRLDKSISRLCWGNLAMFLWREGVLCKRLFLGLSVMSHDRGSNVVSYDRTQAKMHKKLKQKQPKQPLRSLLKSHHK